MVSYPVSDKVIANKQASERARELGYAIGATPPAHLRVIASSWRGPFDLYTLQVQIRTVLAYIQDYRARSYTKYKLTLSLDQEIAVLEQKHAYLSVSKGHASPGNVVGLAAEAAHWEQTLMELEYPKFLDYTFHEAEDHTKRRIANDIYSTDVTVLMQALYELQQWYEDYRVRMRYLCLLQDQLFRRHEHITFEIQVIEIRHNQQSPTHVPPCFVSDVFWKQRADSAKFACRALEELQHSASRRCKLTGVI